MAIPDFQSCMKPLLDILKDGKEHKFRDAVNILANRFNLTDDERSEMLPSGYQTVISNRIGWASTYLKKALCLEKPKRGVMIITQRGYDFFIHHADAVTIKDLCQFDEAAEFLNLKRNASDSQLVVEDTNDQINMTPEEALDYGAGMLNRDLASSLLAMILSKGDRFFEKLSVQILDKMGYGGDFENSSNLVGGPGDGGIDGIIYGDKLGFDAIYVQAKRYKDSVIGRPILQNFAGALAGAKATKGVFITTSKFADTARDYVKSLSAPKIVLIDGIRLCELMIEYGLGVNVSRTIEIKKLDSDFFEDDEMID